MIAKQIEILIGIPDKKTGKQRGFFYWHEIFEYATEKHISERSLKRYLDEYVEKGILVPGVIKKTNEEGRFLGGRPEKIYILQNKTVCEKCLDRQIRYFCSHCGVKICKHYAQKVNGLLLCFRCYREKTFCPKCFINTATSFNRKVQYMIPWEKGWICPNDECEDFGKTQEMNVIDMNWRNVEKIILTKIMELPNSGLNKLRKKQEDYLAKQGTLLKQCKYKKSCFENCFLETENEKARICPFGLPRFNSDCYYCRKCEYKVKVSVKSRNEIEESYECEFFDVISRVILPTHAIKQIIENFYE